jgi:DNA-binding HxlR family transcriptional regulator
MSAVLQSAMELATRDARTLARIANSLKNEKRVKVLKELTGGPKSLSELFEKLSTEIKYNDSLYRYLEDMVETGLVNKKYDVKRKRILYELKVDQITIDFRW